MHRRLRSLLGRARHQPVPRRPPVAPHTSGEEHRFPGEVSPRLLGHRVAGRDEPLHVLLQPRAGVLGLLVIVVTVVTVAVLVLEYKGGRYLLRQTWDRR